MEKDLTRGSPLKLIISFAIPVLIGGLLQQTYALADTLIVGQTISADALAAVGLSAPVTYLMQAIAWGLPNGFALFTAQRFGAHDADGVKKSIATSIWFGLVLSLVLTAVTVLPLGGILNLINTPAELFEMAYDYLLVTSIGYIATVFYNLFAQILRALGDARTPLYFLIVTSLLNVGLDFAFILGFRMGVTGAALATVLSQVVSAVVCFIYAYARFPAFHIALRDFVTSWRFLWEHLRIGLPMCFMFSISAIGSIFVQSVLNTFEPIIIAAVAAVIRIEQFITQSMISVGTATATYTAQNFGAGDIARVKSGVRISIMIQAVLSVIAMTLMLTAGTPLAKLFVKDIDAAQMAQLTAYCNQYIYLHAPCYFFLSLFPTFRNVLQAAGRSSGSFYAGIADLAMRAVCAFVIAPKVGFLGICMAEPLAWVLADIVQIAIYLIMMRNILKSPPPSKPMKDGARTPIPTEEKAETTNTVIPLPPSSLTMRGAYYGKRLNAR